MALVNREGQMSRKRHTSNIIIFYKMALYYQVVVLVLYICYQTDYSYAINEAQVNLFRQFCPYTDFCSSNSSEVLGQTDRRPCCTDCFCDSACLIYGDCCPDLMLAGPKGDNAHVLPVCKEASYQNNFTQTENLFAGDRPMYRVIDECPTEYNDAEMTIEKCAENYTGPTTYDDIVMVSDDDFMLFQNKHCARCHGVIKTTRWNLQVLKCRDDLEDVNLVASETQGYIIKNCVLWSSRPASVPLNGRTMDCRLRSTCSNNVGENIQEACINGPFMPFSFNGPFGNSWFRNVMCFTRTFGDVFEVQNECREIDSDFGKSTIQSYRMLLDLQPDDNDVTMTSSKCGEAETYDHYSDGCRRMYCPPLSVAHYGRCMPLSKQILNLYVELNIVFTPEDTALILNHHRIYPYNDEIEQFYIDRIRKKVNLEKCRISEYSVEIARKSSSDLVEFLIVSLNIYIDENCTLEYLGNRIQTVQAGIRLTWLINNDTIPMEGRYHFGLAKDSYRNDLLLYYYTDNFGKISLIDRFFVCPYFSLSVSEYNERVSNKGSTKLPMNELTPQTVLENGYYALSQTDIAVCVSAKSGGYFYKQRSLEMILFLLYVYIYFL